MGWTGPAARTRPKARNLPTRYGARDVELRRTGFDSQGQLFVSGGIDRDLGAVARWGPRGRSGAQVR